jgi:hypothetical protein
MEPRIDRIVLIGNRRNAAIALCLTGFVTIQSVRAAVSNAPRNTHWLLSMDPIAVPLWLTALLSVALYLYMAWILAMSYRNAQREEQIVIAGWFNVSLLGPLQHLASTPTANAIQWVKAAGLAAAFIAAAYILVKSPPNTEGIAKATKQRLLVFFISAIRFVCNRGANVLRPSITPNYARKRERYLTHM